jgi:hypothetical protein
LAYPFLCRGKGFVIQSDGIYRLDGFAGGETGTYYSEEQEHLNTQNNTPRLTKINGEWSIGVGDRVLHVNLRNILI